MSEFSTGKQILIVEDAPLIRTMLKTQLKRAGHEVDVAGDGIEGLCKFRENRWDVVITDLQMPGMNGEEMAAIIKFESPNTPVILMTGTILEVRDPNAFFATITKPFRGRELLEIVNSAPNA